MKKIVSLIILIIGILGIVLMTSYTLMHKGIKKEVNSKVSKSIEVVSTNYSNNYLTEIFSVYYNNQRHRLKIEYNIDLNAETLEGPLNLVIYFDGKKVLKETLINTISDIEIETLFEDANIDNYVRIKPDDLKVIKLDNKEFLTIKVGFYNDYSEEKYYVINDEGDMVIEDELILRDTSLTYFDDEDQKLDIFYDDKGARVKFEDGAIYYLELFKIQKVYEIREYKYYFKGEELEKEELNIYPSIKVKESTSE